MTLANTINLASAQTDQQMTNFKCSANGSSLGVFLNQNFNSDTRAKQVGVGGHYLHPYSWQSNWRANICFVI